MQSNTMSETDPQETMSPTTNNPVFQREPNRAERRAGQFPRRQRWMLTKDGKILRDADKFKGCFGKPKAYVTKVSADTRKWVEPKATPAVKKPRAKKAKVANPK